MDTPYSVLTSTQILDCGTGKIILPHRLFCLFITFKMTTRKMEVQYSTFKIYDYPQQSLIGGWRTNPQLSKKVIYITPTKCAKVHLTTLSRLKLKIVGMGVVMGFPAHLSVCVCIYVDIRVLYAGTLQNPISNDTF